MKKKLKLVSWTALIFVLLGFGIGRTWHEHVYSITGFRMKEFSNRCYICGKYSAPSAQLWVEYR